MREGISTLGMPPLTLPDFYDYVAVYVTDRCPLRCPYCITEHNDTKFITGTDSAKRLEPAQWASGLNRLKLPAGVPVTLQGGEPFAYPGIWELLDRLEHPIDILTALPKNVTVAQFQKLKPATLSRLNRGAPYPNVRVSYHPGQNKIEELVPRVKELLSVIPIGLYMVAHPEREAEAENARILCEKAGVLFKTKEFLGFHNGKLYGTYLYPEAVAGKVVRDRVMCKNSVLILGPDGLAYRCHSDLYHKRTELAFGRILDENFTVEDKFRSCSFFGLCSECDVKVKNNHLQQFGYTSVQISFNPEAGS
jgi:Radical SAM superfamily